MAIYHWAWHNALWVCFLHEWCTQCCLRSVQKWVAWLTIFASVTPLMLCVNVKTCLVLIAFSFSVSAEPVNWPAWEIILTATSDWQTKQKLLTKLGISVNKYSLKKQSLWEPAFISPLEVFLVWRAFSLSTLRPILIWIAFWGQTDGIERRDHTEIQTRAQCHDQRPVHLRNLVCNAC